MKAMGGCVETVCLCQRADFGGWVAMLCGVWFSGTCFVGVSLVRCALWLGGCWLLVFLGYRASACPSNWPLSLPFGMPVVLSCFLVFFSQCFPLLGRLGVLFWVPLTVCRLRRAVVVAFARCANCLLRGRPNLL